MEEIKTIFEKQVSLIETYLSEFCEVNGISENGLKGKLKLISYPVDNTISVVDSDNKVKFGVTVSTDIEKESIIFNVFGEYLANKESFPKTTNYINSLEL